MPSRIEDYALIGDCHSAALVGRDGSIDWLCLPRFDSGACFAALLGAPENGRWQLTPSGEIRRVSRRYRPNTLVLETEFETATGTVSLVDFMPLRAHEPRLVRMVVGHSGRVTLRMQFIVRFDYGSVVPWVSKTEGGVRAIAGPDTIVLHTPVPLRGEGLTTVAEFTIAEGESVPFVMTWYPSHEPAPATIDPAATLEETDQWWQEWTSRCSYTGPWRETVVRSLITLKALTYAPTGGIVAAPTTSLPEQLGGVRNWDYRICWLRDATFTLYSLMRSGFIEEARAWRLWLIRAVAGTPSQVNIMYGLAGERRLTELELDWLPGYENSRPVRIGNAAHSQFQLDVFGEVAGAMHVARVAGLEADADGWNVEREMLRFLESAWKESDEGIWEVRGPRRHFTHSKVMAWLAFDRMITSAEQFGLQGPVDRWKQVRATIHEDVCRNGFDAERGTFVQYYGSKAVDASLLLIPIVGFLPVTDARVRGTIETIERELMAGGFVLRYPTTQEVDGLPPGEGVFLACTLWLANALLLLDRRDDARVLFERVLGLCNDVGLLSEEYDVDARRLVANFPQALSHVSLVMTAFRLAGVVPKHEARAT
ncbi:MAG: glycoside hydrolase family 15 protein [Burkholderiales bacterium]